MKRGTCRPRYAGYHGSGKIRAGARIDIALAAGHDGLRGGVSAGNAGEEGKGGRAHQKSVRAGVFQSRMSMVKP